MSFLTANCCAEMRATLMHGVQERDRIAQMSQPVLRVLFQAVPEVGGRLSRTVRCRPTPSLAIA
jgi:hypothetical protein